jgi:hypothetical protein
MLRQCPCPDKLAMQTAAAVLSALRGEVQNMADFGFDGGIFRSGEEGREVRIDNFERLGG